MSYKAISRTELKTLPLEMRRFYINDGTQTVEAASKTD
jgi:hypothetical protein